MHDLRQVHKNNLLERDKNGEPVSIDDPDYSVIKRIINEAKRLTMRMNTQVLGCDEIRNIFSELTGQAIDPLFTLWTPFYTDFGKNIRVGRNVFINHACTFMDRGGITLEDDVFIGPKVCLITENHGLREEERRTLNSHPIRVCKGAWIGAGAIVLPGVTIGEYAVVGAGSVVTHDVPDHVVAAGNPAKIIKSTEEKV